MKEQLQFNEANEQLLFGVLEGGKAQNKLILDHLQSNPLVWVPMPSLVDMSGAYAVHSRIADLRKQGHKIENKVDRSTKPFKSFYRLTP